VKVVKPLQFSTPVVLPCGRLLIYTKKLATFVSLKAASFLLVKLREPESSTHLKTALTPGFRWCSLSPVSPRSAFLVELLGPEDSA